MDKSRDVRRVQSRFSPAKRQIKQSVHKLLSGLDACEAVFQEKPKKERVKKLSVVGRVNFVNDDPEMGCSGTCRSEEDEDQLRSPPLTTKRFKLPKKFFDDCNGNGVDHSSVPRKLRSAMKKRGRESVSPPLPAPSSKKLNNNGVETPSKKSKLYSHGGSELSQKQAITKDEEEVVETLYALAGMFPGDSDKTSRYKDELIGVSTESKPLTVTDAMEENHTPTLVSEESSKCQIEAATPRCDSPGETVEKVKCLNGAPVEEQPNTPTDKKQERTESLYLSPVPQLNPQTVPFLSKAEPAGEKSAAPPMSLKFEVPDELNQDDKGGMMLEQQEAPAPETKLEVSQGPDQQYTINDGRKNDLVLWPGLSSTGSLGAAVFGPPLLSSAKTQPWPENGTAGPRSSEKNGISTENVSRVTVLKKQPWKRCAAHVRISQLIRDLQNTEREEKFSIQPKRLRTDEGSKQVVPPVDNNPSGLRSGSNVVVFANSEDASAVEKNSSEARKGILLQRELHQDKRRAPASASASVTYTSQKQSYDFLSLSAGGGGAEANNGTNTNTNIVANDLEPTSQLHVPYLHSLPQHHTLLPYSLPQSRYSSSPYPEQLSAAAAAVTQQVQLQLSPYLSNNLCGSPHMVPSGSKQQQQLQQQRMWAQLAAQYRPVAAAGTGVSTSTYSSNWQNGRHDPIPQIQYAQGILPPSSSLEVLGPKYAPISQQHQQELIAISSTLSPARVKRQHNHLPSGFDENGGSAGFRTESALPLQLLCNEHL